MRDHLAVIEKRLALVKKGHADMLAENDALRRAGRTVVAYLKSLACENPKEPSEKWKAEIKAAMRLLG